MKKQKKLLITILVFAMIILTGSKVLATNTLVKEAELEISDEFKKYLELDEDEAKNAIAPRMYNIPLQKDYTDNPLKMVRMLGGSTLEEDYTLKDTIPENIIVRNQGQTMNCWAFGSIGALESTLGLLDYKNGKTAVAYDFSERHMQYATVKTFTDGTNTIGFNRTPDQGGHTIISRAYLTNGTGAIAENDMKYKESMDPISLSEIQGKKVITQVNDAIDFPTASSEAEKTELMQKMKEHIKNYGGIEAGIYGADVMDSKCYNNETGALYCDNSYLYGINHEVLIVGWDDNFDKSNFLSTKQPSNNGAWIIKNSWGTEYRYTLEEMKEIIFEVYKGQTDNPYTSADEITDEEAKETFEKIGFTIENNEAVYKIGDNGFMYVSYEDANIYSSLAGFTDVTTELSYENIYQYDEYGSLGSIEYKSSKTYLATEFTKKTEGKEYINQVAITAPEKYTVKVYVNPNGTSKSKTDLVQAKLKTGETETIDAGYHTIEFEEPIEITGTEFVVVMEIQGERTSGIGVNIELDYCAIYGCSSNKALISHFWEGVEASEKCYVTFEDDFSSNKWYSLGIKDEAEATHIVDTTIKAFTVSPTPEKTVKSISAKTLPSKKEYIQNIDKLDLTGGIIEVEYNGETTKGEIAMTSDEVEVTGFDNTKLGKNTITLKYKEKTTQFDVTIIEKQETPKAPTNSEFKDSTGNVTNIKANSFTDENKDSYSEITIEIDNIKFATGNDKMEYYYYLSAQSDETVISKWYKAKEVSTSGNKLTIKIDTSDISNYEDLEEAEKIYLYIKEVVTLNDEKAEVITSGIKLDASKAKIVQYLDGEVVKETEGSDYKKTEEKENGKKDDTKAPGVLPYNGKNLIIIGFIIAIAISTVIVYINYKKIQIK